MTQQTNGLFPASCWHEDYGPVLWWCWDDEGGWLGEPPYVGSPLDCGISVEMRSGDGQVIRTFVGGWPGYHTHWTRLPDPPASPEKMPQGEPT